MSGLGSTQALEGGKLSVVVRSFIRGREDIEQVTQPSCACKMMF